MEQRYMHAALIQARRAADMGEVPVGAVVVRGGGIIAQAHNLRETLQDPTAHAEVLALRAASEATGSWRLTGCALYVTLEPCPMCMGAIMNARIGSVVFGAFDGQAGCCGSVCNFSQTGALLGYIKPEIIGGILEDECAALLKDFFSKRREREYL